MQIFAPEISVETWYLSVSFVMIKLIQIDKYSLHLEIDQEGCGLMLQAFQNAIRHQTVSVDIALDKHIYSHKHELISKSLSVVLSKENDSFSIVNDKAVLALEHDVLEYGIDRFSEGYTEGGIFPAELCNVNVRQRSFTIYAILVEA